MKHLANYINDRNYPEFPPDGWTLVEKWGDDYALKCKGLRVIIDVNFLSETSIWLHVSYSRASYLPTWEDTKIVKEAFIGPENEAIIVLPTAADYVNIHQYCLHLWHPLKDNPIPNFTATIGGIKSI